MLVASGVSYRQLDTPGFAELTGAGVYYGAAMTEARACAEQHIVVIGGANSAGQAAVYFSNYAASVTMLVRGAIARSVDVALPDRADRSARQRRTCAPARPPPPPRASDGELQKIHVAGPDGEDALRADACFVFIGASPRTDWLEGVIARDARGFILAGRDAQANGWPLEREPFVLETSVPGVFVAGDVRARSIKRVASAVGEGSMAVSLIHEYLVEA